MAMALAVASVVGLVLASAAVGEDGDSMATLGNRSRPLLRR